MTRVLYSTIYANHGQQQREVWDQKTLTREEFCLLPILVKNREYWTTYTVERQGFLQSYDSAPHSPPPPFPVSKLHPQHTGRLKKRGNLLTWASMNHSILSGISCSCGCLLPSLDSRRTVERYWMHQRLTFNVRNALRVSFLLLYPPLWSGGEVEVLAEKPKFTFCPSSALQHIRRIMTGILSLSSSIAIPLSLYLFPSLSISFFLPLSLSFLCLLYRSPLLPPFIYLPLSLYAQSKLLWVYRARVVYWNQWDIRHIT